MFSARRRTAAETAASPRTALLLSLTVFAVNSACEADVRLFLKGTSPGNSLTPVSLKVGELLQLGVSKTNPPTPVKKFHWKVVKPNTPAGLTYLGDRRVAIDTAKLGLYLDDKGLLLRPDSSAAADPIRDELIDLSGAIQFVDATGQKAAGDGDAASTVTAPDIAGSTTSGDLDATTSLSGIYIKGVKYGTEAIVLIQADGSKEFDAVLIKVDQKAQLNYSPAQKTSKIALSEGQQIDLSATADLPNADINNVTWKSDRPDIVGLWTDNPPGVGGEPVVTNSVSAKAKTVVHFKALLPGVATITLSGEDSNSVTPADPLTITVAPVANTARLVKVPALLRPGQTATAAVELLNERGNIVPISTEPGLKVESSNTGVVKAGPVDSQGNFVLTAVDAGAATLIVKKKDDSILGTALQVLVGQVDKFGYIDAHFTVLPEHEAKKVFGGQVADNFYVVNLSILNNIFDHEDVRDANSRLVPKSILVYSSTVRAAVTLDKLYDVKSQSKPKASKEQAEIDKIWTPVTVSDDWQRFNGLVKEVNYDTLSPYTPRFESRAPQHVRMDDTWGQPPAPSGPAPSETSGNTTQVSQQMTRVATKAVLIGDQINFLGRAITRVEDLRAQVKTQSAKVAALKADVDKSNFQIQSIRSQLNSSNDANQKNLLNNALREANLNNSHKSKELNDGKLLAQSLQLEKKAADSTLQDAKLEEAQLIAELEAQVLAAKRQADSAVASSKLDLDTAKESLQALEALKPAFASETSGSNSRALGLAQSRARSAVESAHLAVEAAVDSQAKAALAVTAVQDLSRKVMGDREAASTWSSELMTEPTNDSEKSKLARRAIEAAKTAKQSAEAAAAAAVLANSAMTKIYHIEVSTDCLKVKVGERIRIRVRIVDGTGATVAVANLPAPIQWRSENESIATVTQDGLVTARSSGLSPEARTEARAKAEAEAEARRVRNGGQGVVACPPQNCLYLDKDACASTVAEGCNWRSTIIHVTMDGLDIPIKVIVEENDSPLLYPYFPYNYELLAMGVAPREQDSKRHRLFSIIDAAGSFATSLTTLRVLRGSSNEILNNVNGLLLPALKKAFPDMSDLQRQNILNQAMKDTEVIAAGDSLSKKLFFPKKPFRGYLPNFLTRISGIDNSYITVDIATIEQRKTIAASSISPSVAPPPVIPPAVAPPTAPAPADN